MLQSPVDARKKSDRICDQIIQMPAFQKAETIYAYMAANGEVSLGFLLDYGWKKGKKVAVPKINGNDMEFYYIGSYLDVSPGYFHIMEPKGDMVAENEDALILVPGVAFGKNGARMGYGKGFYDKYLSAHPGHPTIAPAYEFQVLDSLITQPWDVPVEQIVTENRIYQGDME